MEHLNKIELRGRVGRIKREMVGDEEVARISLGVQTVSRTFTGAAVSGIDWFNIVAWKGPKVNFDAVTDDSIVYVAGRVRMCSYMGADGRESRIMEVVANQLKWEGR